MHNLEGTLPTQNDYKKSQNKSHFFQKSNFVELTAVVSKWVKWCGNQQQNLHTSWNIYAEKLPLQTNPNEAVLRRLQK